MRQGLQKATRLMQLSAMNWGDQQYLRDHVITIAGLVSDEMKRQSKSK